MLASVERQPAKRKRFFFEKKNQKTITSKALLGGFQVMGSAHGFGYQAGAERFRQARLTVAVAAISKPRV
jgi:hypothetical protein